MAADLTPSEILQKHLVEPLQNKLCESELRVQQLAQRVVKLEALVATIKRMLMVLAGFLLLLFLVVIVMIIL